VVEGPPILTEPERPQLRPRPSRKRLAARRTVALVLLGGSLALLAWLGLLIADTVGKDKPKPPPPPPVLRIIFPEGFTRQQMAGRIIAVDGIAQRTRGADPKLSASDYLAATQSSKLPGRFAGDGKARPLEGFLFPSAYDFRPWTRSQHLVREQLAAFRETWSKVDLSYARSKNLTPYDVLIIASMIEKEVRVAKERRLVAAVIYNRLHARMPLGIDATIRYGLNIPPTQSLTVAQLHSSNPYNTRNHFSLPPTPISNPGLPSMQAAAHPAKVDYLYFVRKPDKLHHFFTSSLKKFIAYQRAHG